MQGFITGLRSNKIPHVLKTGKEMQHNLQMTHSEVLVEVLYEGSPGLGGFRVGTRHRWAPPSVGTRHLARRQTPPPPTQALEALGALKLEWKMIKREEEKLIIGKCRLDPSMSPPLD